MEIDAGLRKGRRTVTGIAAAGLLLVVSLHAAAAVDGPSSPLAAARFAWRDDSGRSFDLAGLSTRPLILTMAFTRCKYVCPMAVRHLQEMQQQFDALGQSAEFVIVGYADAYDDPPSWHRYRRRHDLRRPNWHFLTATSSDSEKFARSFGFASWKYDEHVMHELRILIFDRDGTVRVWNGGADAPMSQPQS